MADDTKKGPVKPPIIDAKPAPKAEGAKAASATSPQKPAAPKPTPNNFGNQTKPDQTNSGSKKTATAEQTDKPKSGLTFSTLIIATLLGAGLGTGATSFMALNGIAPFQKSISTSQFNAAMETLQKRVFDLENAPQTDLSGFVTSAQLDGFASSDALTGVNAQISTIADKVAALEIVLKAVDQNQISTTEPLVNSEQIAQIQSEIEGLKSSILELSPDNTKALEAQLEQNQKLVSAIAQISSLGEVQSTNVAAVAGLGQQLADLSQTVNGLAEQINAEPAPVELPATANLPLLLDAWEKALNAGDAYADYVTSAAAILPDLVLSDVLSKSAQSGVTTTSALNSDFAAAIPAFVASDADLPADATWYDRFIAQAKSAIGLRPLDQSGNDPLAVVAQIEAALANNNLKAAQLAYARLPQEWQDMSADFASKLAAKNDAIAQLDQAQKLALDLATTHQGAAQ
ncbi:hypothetical protein [uncultured Maritalea sp.]|jgi:hypothetical protein|uniref:COG4223 family protein n=1 Tax=uncultured Maritalea sp. TaxID=757249 RepID=UPI0026367D2A|nr:hypothetical protein [uncultured Maritalea sp.]